MDRIKHLDQELGLISLMKENAEIRISRADDIDQLEQLYPLAFPDEDLLPLVRKLFAENSAISCVAANGAGIVGHIALTRCSITGLEEDAALLGPLAVAPERQNQGIGSKLVEYGFQQLIHSGICWVFVLGDPGYYSRFGFQKETGIRPPYELPKEWSEAWQSVQLNRKRVLNDGVLMVPTVWQDPKLWLP